MVARLLWEQDAAGSSPVTSTIKETSFVYQDKPDFLLSAAETVRKRRCTHRISLLCKQPLNVFRVWDLNRMFAKNPVQVMI